MYLTNQQEIRSTFLETREKTTGLCAVLEKEDFVPQPIEDVSPPKWHLAHTSWFFEQMILMNQLPDYKFFNKKYLHLFNSYYNTFGERTKRNQRGTFSRPSVDEIFSYREYINQQMTALLENDLSQEVLQLIELGIQYEQQHQELLTYDIKYILGKSPFLPNCGDYLISTNQNPQKWIKTNEGIYEIGADNSSFCFDIELGKHKVFLHDFEISNQLTTNQEYLEFINNGGYKNPLLWHDEGWNFIKKNKIKSPLHWHFEDDCWKIYQKQGLDELNPKIPVSHISFFEAFAFAEWAGYRLPTEFEWEIASNQFDWGTLWEWTYSSFLPYPNYQKKLGAIGEYNGKFMVNLMVLRGASVATQKNHSRKTYRNFFHTGARWLFSGMRVCKK